MRPPAHIRFIDDGPHENRQRLLESFKFDQIDSRKTTIKEEEEKTCRWFLSHSDYEAWLDPAKLTQHHGFLWISGKPGAGKSTIMKFLYMKMKSKTRRKHAVTASFFFNARGTDLEKSTSGMYRSLLLQLLEGYPDLQVVLDDSDLVPQNQDDCPSLIVLRTIFENAVCTLGKRSLTCFIDALDECDEQQVVEMVQYFETLTKKSTEKGISFRTCFSSRHYPYIFIQRGIRLTLERQSGHAEDLSTYVTSRLDIREPSLIAELKPQILGKAAGVFMWVVLVVGILNKEYRRGGMSLRKRLAELPSDLSELFKDILRRDKDDMEALQLCILWILYAKKPLRPQELYHALWIGLSPNDLVDGQVPDATVSVVGAGPDTCRITRSVISYSKGLAETTKATKSNQPIVQFIHESVRDFLIKDKGLYELWPELGLDCEGVGHEKLKQCCDLYLNHGLISKTVTTLPKESDANQRAEALVEISKSYPFLGYASQHILFHANAAAKVVPQDRFLSSRADLYWIDMSNLFKNIKSHKYSRNASLSYILADRGCPDLIRARSKEDMQNQVRERYNYPLFAALANGDEDTVAAILDTSSGFHGGISLTEGLNFKKDFKNYKRRTPLSWAAQEGRAGIVKLLLQNGVDIEGVDGNGLTPLLRASYNGQETVARLLVDMGADINACDGQARSALLFSVMGRHKTISRLLIDNGADVNGSDKKRSTPLHWSARRGNEATTRLLVDKGADPNASDKDGWTPLQWCSASGHHDVAGLLIEKGANVHINASEPDGQTPLQLSSANGHEAVVKLLLDKGANINVRNRTGWTPLHLSSSNGHYAAAKLLLSRGADYNAREIDGGTPLQWSIRKEHNELARLIIEMGADINAGDEFGRTLLHLSSWNKGTKPVRLLLSLGADVNANDNHGWTPLHQTSANGVEEISRLLLEEGTHINVNAGDENGRTPLQWSSANGHEAIVELLISARANIDPSDNFGRTPLHEASLNGHEAVARFLIKNGANINTSDKLGQTPLGQAMAHGHDNIATLMLTELELANLHAEKQN